MSILLKGVGPILSGNNYDPDAILVFLKMDAAGASPSNAFKTVINNYILNLKGLGAYGSYDIYNNVFDSFQPYATETELQALISWKGNNQTKYNSPTYVAKSGWLPVGIGSNTLWTNFTPSVNGVKYTQNSCCALVWLGANPGASYFMGALSTHKTALRTVTTNNDNYCNSSSFGLANFGTSTEGLFTINRASSGTFKTIKNSTVISTVASASSGRPDYKMALAGYANSPTTITAIPSLSNPIKLSAAGGNIEPYISQFYQSTDQYIAEVAAL